MNVIVVGVDGSNTAECAAREAASFAAATGARLHIVTALTKDRSATVKGGGECWQITSLDHAEQLLADLAQRVTPPDVERSTAVVDGKPADALCDEAERVGADLIVVGNKRMTGVGRILGSIANDVAHHAPCSVYIAKTT
jgi:nucleotide-binding universal stress UspA family protein